MKSNVKHSYEFCIPLLLSSFTFKSFLHLWVAHVLNIPTSTYTHARMRSKHNNNNCYSVEYHTEVCLLHTWSRYNVPTALRCFLLACVCIRTTFMCTHTHARTHTCGLANNGKKSRAAQYCLCSFNSGVKLDRQNEKLKNLSTSSWLYYTIIIMCSFIFLYIKSCLRFECCCNAVSFKK